MDGWMENFSHFSQYDNFKLKIFFSSRILDSIIRCELLLYTALHQTLDFVVLVPVGENILILSRMYQHHKSPGDGLIFLNVMDESTILHQQTFHRPGAGLGMDFVSMFAFNWNIKWGCSYINHIFYNYYSVHDSFWILVRNKVFFISNGMSR